MLNYTNFWPAVGLTIGVGMLVTAALCLLLATFSPDWFRAADGTGLPLFQRGAPVTTVRTSGGTTSRKPHDAARAFRHRPGAGPNRRPGTGLGAGRQSPAWDRPPIPSRPRPSRSSSPVGHAPELLLTTSGPH